MNYSLAIKKSQDYSQAIKEVLDQSLLELKRQMTIEEKENLFQYFSPQLISARIKKVDKIYIDIFLYCIFIVWFWKHHVYAVGLQ